MSNIKLNKAARLENARALAASVGMDVATASEKLNINLLINYDMADSSASLLAQEVVALLERTVTYIGNEIAEHSIAVEIVIGNVSPKTNSPHLFVSGSSNLVKISRKIDHNGIYITPHPILRLLSACYVSSTALKLATGDILQISISDPLLLDFSELGLNLNKLDSTIMLDKAYLAGAGAIGNGFIWALRYLNVEGELHVADDDIVDDGNLNRQIWFTENDVGQFKVEQLTQKAQQYFPKLQLVPRNKRIQSLEERSSGAWLSRLIIGVDSPKARRDLQNEVPGEVFDASTTDIREVVIHYHKQITENACLSCVYSESLQEISREEHIASHLGLTRDKVMMQMIDREAAGLIVKRFNDKLSNPEELIGIAYDTLFKRLCGEKPMVSTEGKQIIAPFAFVSVLAGTLLAIELARRLQVVGHKVVFNYWSVSAWHPPLGRKQRLLPAKANCDFCSKALCRSVVKKLWGQ